jgi:hypothetical protein
VSMHTPSSPMPVVVHRRVAYLLTPSAVCHPLKLTTLHQMLANHYPERLYKAYICNAPSIFSLAYKVQIRPRFGGGV